MARSEAVRQAALERDGRRCQITGAGGTEWQGVVDVAHWKALGFGGSDELDKLENVITASSIIHRTYIHPGVSVPTLRITHWDPADPIDGLIVERRENADDEWSPVPKMEVWFYRKQFVEHVKENLGNMHSIQTLTGYHAMTMFELRMVWEDIDPTAAGFDQLVSGMGWDPNEAHDIADKHEWMMEHKSQWPEGLTNSQVTEIIGRNAPITLFDEPGEEHPTETMQAMLSTAAEKSFTDLKNALIAKKLKFAQPFYFFVIPMCYLPADKDWGDYLWSQICIIQSRDEEGLKKAIRDGEICDDMDCPVVFRMGKAVMNLESRKNSLRLKDGDKTLVKVLQWPIPKRTEMVFGCSACGLDHEIEFSLFDDPEGKYPYRGICNNTGETVYMKETGDVRDDG